MKTSNLKVGPTEFCEGGFLQIGQYANGEVAIAIVTESGERQAVATVFLETAPIIGPTKVWLKGWSENAGMPEALRDAGLVTLTGRSHPTGFVFALEAELTNPVILFMMGGK